MALKIKSYDAIFILLCFLKVVSVENILTVTFGIKCNMIGLLTFCMNRLTTNILYIYRCDTFE